MCEGRREEVGDRDSSVCKTSANLEEAAIFTNAFHYGGNSKFHTNTGLLKNDLPFQYHNPVCVNICKYKFVQKRCRKYIVKIASQDNYGANNFFHMQNIALTLAANTTTF